MHPSHVIWDIWDADRPRVICDSNGDVLALCRNCGRVEVELDDDAPCAAPCPPLPFLLVPTPYMAYPVIALAMAAAMLACLPLVALLGGVRDQHD